MSSNINFETDAKKKLCLLQFSKIDFAIQNFFYIYFLYYIYIFNKYIATTATAIRRFLIIIVTVRL